MPFPEFEPTPPVAPEANINVSQLSGAETQSFGVEQQLNAPQDVSSASQFFQGSAAPHLPEITISDGGATSAVGTGAEQMMMHPPEAMLGRSMPAPGAEMAAVAPSIPGAESAALTLAPGAESAAMLSGVTPGAEPISPLIQLIMKMPGAMGVINSVFEFLGALFGGGNLIALFDPILWLQQASASLATFTISFVEGLPMAIMNNTLSPNTFFSSLADHFQKVAVSSTSTQVGNVGAQPLANSSLNVSGPANLNKPMFEQTDLIAQGPSTPNMYGDWGPQNFYATNSGQQLMGNYSQSPSVPTTSTPPTSIQYHQAPAATPHAPAHHTPAANHGASHHNTTHYPRHQVEAAPRPSQAATTDGAAQPAGDYMVQKGDNLWQIAQDQLGDGSRWGEIYQLNNSTIGGDPSLIHAGTQLKMPDAPIATADGGHYVVQSGDNLWDISRQHFGDGSRWTEIYQNNQAVIGDNPHMIHPGQQLDLQGGGDATTVASANSHPSLAHTSPATTAHAGVGQVHTPIHAPTVHHTPAVSHHVTTSGHGPQLAQASPHGHATTTHASATLPAASAPHAGLQAQQPILDTGSGAATSSPTGDFVPQQYAPNASSSFAKSASALGDAGVSTAGSPGNLDPSGIDPSYLNKQP